MTSKGDKYRRDTCYTEGAVENSAAAAAMSASYAQLSCLITDDFTANVFQATYCRITRRYHGGDFVKQFRTLFWSTMREYLNERRRYKAMIYALPSETQAEENEPQD